MTMREIYKAFKNIEPEMGEWLTETINAKGVVTTDEYFEEAGKRIGVDLLSLLQPLNISGTISDPNWHSPS